MSNQFAELFDAWLQANPEQRTHEKVAAALGTTNAAISHWRNGKYVPDKQYIPRLAELMGESHFYLAHLAYGWELEAPADPALREPLIRELLLLAKQLAVKSPDMLPAVLEMARGLLRLARRRGKGGEAGGDPL